MSTPAEEVYVVEQLVKDEFGLWWKPTFTHTSMAVALGKLESLGAHYTEGIESTRVRVYMGTSTVISRAAVKSVLDRLAFESKVLCSTKEQATDIDMIEHVMKKWVPVGEDPLGGRAIPFVEKLMDNPEIFDQLQKRAVPPLEILNREFEYSDSAEVEKAEVHLLHTSDLWVTQEMWKKMAPKKMVSVPTPVAEGPPLDGLCCNEYPPRPAKDPDEGLNRMVKQFKDQQSRHGEDCQCHLHRALRGESDEFPSKPQER